MSGEANTLYVATDGSDDDHWDDQVPEEIKRRRFDRGMKLQQEISAENNRRLIGRTLPVLIDGQAENDPRVYCGRSYQDAPEVDGLVYVTAPENKKLAPGDIVLTKIKKAQEYDLAGSVL